MSGCPKIAVIGLGYVGLPLAVHLADHFEIVGFDVDATRVSELRSGSDRTGEIDSETLSAARLTITDDEASLDSIDVFIVTVPTPVDDQNRPDLGAVRAASETVARRLRKGVIVVYESTVYPGVTEDECGPTLERGSGLVCGEDFFLGYSPERINPGDREHTVDRITKVVAGQTPDVTETLAGIYGALNGGDIYRARNIRTAEAAKVIENAQRDINIAFVNEVAMILNGMGLDVLDVLDAADTKWNFLPFKPGLVGGHCIGVDPFYLAHAAQSIGLNPEIVLAGRRINDAMGSYIAQDIHDALDGKAGRVLVLGLTFKENVPDLRNSRVVDIVTALRDLGHDVDVHDPQASPSEAKELFGVDLMTDLADAAGYDAVVGAVKHREYDALDAAALEALISEGGLVADIKGIWRELELSARTQRWQL
jgi:UDP-N-acetyl-D-glucosamine/UDP-N-acetyl-D-galactosamine dehydrogenase